MDLIGFNDSPLAKAFSEPQTAGLRMGGTYKAENGIAIAFNADSASITACGSLLPAGGTYSVTRRGNGLLIEIANQPHPLIVALGPSGQMTGPGPADITGSIITGYRTYDVWKRYADGSTVPGSLHQEREPILGPKTERCTFSTLHPVAATASDDSTLSLISGLFGGQKSEQMKQDEQHPTPAGPRVSGIYTSAGGLRLEFHPVAVILDCGEAHTLASYSVHITADQTLVAVADKNAPFSVAFQSNGTMSGSGDVEVAGRLLTGQTDSGFVYEPRGAAIGRPSGTLMPGEGSGAPVASGNSAGANSGTGSVAPASASPSTMANARLSVVAVFPAGSNPLAGARVILMKDRFNNVLRSIGVPLPANATPGQAMAAWATGCKPPTDCKPLAAAMSSYFVGRTNLDATGRGVIAPAVPSGTYYVLASARGGNNEALAWDLPIELRAGENSITLNPANAEIVH